MTQVPSMENEMPAYEYRTPTKTTTPVADTTAGLWTFGSPSSHLLLTNRSGQIVYFRFNSADDASVAVHDLNLADGETINLKESDLGVGNFTTVSAWFPAAATVADFTIRGI